MVVDMRGGWQWAPCQLLPPPQTTTQDLIDNRILELHADFAEIVSTDSSAQDILKARLNALFSFAASQGLIGCAVLEGLRHVFHQLQWPLLDTRNFSLFYRFVFFLCREEGQKNLAVSTAIEAWNLTLSGRFRLLDRWIAFVQVHQRHAITEDTWRQVLEFSRVVHEDLSNYDPEGAWPVLVDEFVDHMYRCSCIDMCNCEPPLDVTNNGLLPGPAYTGMAASAGSKRRRKDGPEELSLSRHLKRLLLENPLHRPPAAGGFAACQ